MPHNDHPTTASRVALSTRQASPESLGAPPRPPEDGVSGDFEAHLQPPKHSISSGSARVSLEPTPPSPSCSHSHPWIASRVATLRQKSVHLREDRHRKLGHWCVVDTFEPHFRRRSGSSRAMNLSVSSTALSLPHLCVARQSLSFRFGFFCR